MHRRRTSPARSLASGSELHANAICSRRNNRFGAGLRIHGCSISQRSREMKCKVVKNSSAKRTYPPEFTNIKSLRHSERQRCGHRPQHREPTSNSGFGPILLKHFCVVTPHFQRGASVKCKRHSFLCIRSIPPIPMFGSSLLHTPALPFARAAI